MTPAERLDYLLADVWVPTNLQITISDLESALDDYGFAVVRLTLDAATVPQIVDGMTPTEVMTAKVTSKKIEDAVEAMRSDGGLSLSSVARQSVIDQLANAGQWPDEVRDKVKSLGGAWRKQWQIEGYDVQPTLESVTLEITKQTMRKSASDAYNDFIDALDAWDGQGEPPVLGGE